MQPFKVISRYLAGHTEHFDVSHAYVATKIWFLWQRNTKMKNTTELPKNGDMVAAIYEPATTSATRDS